MKESLNKNQAQFIKLGFILVVFMLVVVSIYFYNFFAKDYFNHTKISVVGTSTQDVENSIATFNAYLESKNELKEVAVNNTEQKTQNLISSLEDFGISKENIKTQRVNVWQEEFYNDETRDYELKDWVASTSLEIKLENSTDATNITQLLASLDVNNFDGPYLSYEKTDVNDQELIESAYLDAYTKAEQIAQATGQKIVKPISIDVSDSTNNYPAPMPMRAMGMAEDAAAIPIEPGTSESSKTIFVVFELR